MTRQEKQEKINKIALLRKGIHDLKQLKKEVKGRDNSKLYKNSKINECAKQCLDNSGWVTMRLNTLDRYISNVQIKIEELKLEIAY